MRRRTEHGLPPDEKNTKMWPSIRLFPPLCPISLTSDQALIRFSGSCTGCKSGSEWEIRHHHRKRQKQEARNSDNERNIYELMLIAEDKTEKKQRRDKTADHTLNTTAMCDGPPRERCTRLVPGTWAADSDCMTENANPSGGSNAGKSIYQPPRMTSLHSSVT
jgi:hypothetical protein